MDDLIPTATVIFFGTAVLTAVLFRIEGLTKVEKAIVVTSFAGHAVAAIVMIVLTREAWGGGDIFAYHRVATSLTRYLRIDPEYVLPEVLGLLFQKDVVLPSWVFGMGRSTGSMIALTALLEWGLGDSMYGVSMLFAMVSFFGKVGLYVVGRETLPNRYHLRIAIAVLLLPSVVYWSSGILKESLAMGGLGLLVLGTHRLLKRRFVPALLVCVPGLFLVAISKAFLLFALAGAVGVWFYWTMSMRGTSVTVRPAHLLLGVALAAVGVIVLGQLFPRYTFADLGSDIAQLQSVADAGRGGSTYAIGDPTATTLSGQLAFAPLALLYALFRPLVFEVHNLPMAVSALEATVLAILLGRVLFVRPWADTWRMLSASPFLIFCIVFSIGIATAVGLATTNLGTLVRYRMPILPFYAIVLFVLGAPAPVRSPSDVSAESERSNAALPSVLPRDAQEA